MQVQGRPLGLWELSVLDQWSHKPAGWIATLSAAEHSARAIMGSAPSTTPRTEAAEMTRNPQIHAAPAPTCLAAWQMLTTVLQLPHGSVPSARNLGE